MKIFLSILLISLSLQVAAVTKAPEKPELQWQSTTLSEETISHIQQAKYQYMECITKEMQKQEYSKMDTRVATDKVIKHCETTLSHVRKVFAEEKVPTNIIDRYLKSTRTQTARKVLEHMMIAAAKK